jgi:hypothetical protein
VGAITNIVKQYVPASYAALAGATNSYYSLEELQNLADFVKFRLYNTVVAELSEAVVYNPKEQRLLGVLTTLQFIPAAIDFWGDSLASTATTGTHESDSFFDHRPDLWKIFDRLTIEAQALSEDIGINIYAARGVVPKVFWAALNRGNEEWFVETIEDSNFYAGTIPSLINSPIEKYPNVCTICYISNPPNSTDDVGELYSDVLAIEVMVKSINSEEEVNSRIQKTLDAVNLVFMDSLENRTLNNTIPMLNAPRMTIGDVFVRREKTNVGDRWYWQGGSLEYIVNKFMDFN